MKPLFSSLVQILERRASRGNPSYWPQATLNSLREAAAQENYSPAAVAEALATFSPSWPNGNYLESSASLGGVILIVDSFLSQVSLPSALLDRVSVVVGRLKRIAAHVEALEALCSSPDATPKSA